MSGSPFSFANSDRLYQIERVAILSAAVGRARLYLAQGAADAAKEVLDSAALETRALLERHLPLFDTDRLTLAEEDPSILDE